VQKYRTLGKIRYIAFVTQKRLHLPLTLCRHGFPTFRFVCTKAGCLQHVTMFAVSYCALTETTRKKMQVSCCLHFKDARMRTELSADCCCLPGSRKVSVLSLQPGSGRAMFLKNCSVPIEQPSGYYMYRQFNIQQFYFLPTLCIYVFCVDLRTNSDYFPIQH